MDRQVEKTNVAAGLTEPQARELGRNWKVYWAGFAGLVVILLTLYFVTQYGVKDDGYYRGDGVSDTGYVKEQNDYNEPEVGNENLGQPGASLWRFTPRHTAPVYYT
jgi:hypothetical protein